MLDLPVPEDSEALALEPRESYDPAIIGLAHRFNAEFLVYDEAKLLEIIASETAPDDEDPETSAAEHYSFNILGAWVGEGTPAFVQLWQHQPTELFRAWIVGTPIPEGSKRAFVNRATGRVHVADQQGIKLTSWRYELSTGIGRAMSETGIGEPLAGPLVVGLTFFLNRPGYHYGSGKNANSVRPAAEAYPNRRPDIDKLIRAVLDGGTDARLWADDSQVVSVTGRKRWAERDGSLEGVSIVVGRP